MGQTEAMSKTSNIRNVCILAHVDHGKSTLVDCLLSACGLMAPEAAGDMRATDTREDEVEMGISIKSTPVSLSYNYSNANGGGDRYLFNIIDCPGHVDFSGEVTGALRISDGALVLVDAVDGVRAQTRVVLRELLSNHVRPLLVINKMDRLFMEKKLDGEEAYKALFRIVEEVNSVIAMNGDDDALGDCQVSPATCTVAFAAGVQGWAFTLDTFVKIYSSVSNEPINEAKYLSFAWGDHFCNKVRKTWSTSKIDDSSTRGFVHIVYNPLCWMLKVCRDNNQAKISKLLRLTNCELKSEALGMTGKDLFRSLMHQLLPAGDSLMTMMIKNLPSPAVAQSYRVDRLYDGPSDDPYACAMKNCDANGPLMIHVIKLVPAGDQAGRFFAFGRVFSGTVTHGAKVRVISTGRAGDAVESVKTVHRVGLYMLKNFEAVDAMPCGSTVVLAGLDTAIAKSGTVTGCNDKAAQRFRMLFPVAALVRVSVSSPDVKKLKKALDIIDKCDPHVQCLTGERGENILATVGELHLQASLRDLRRYMAGAQLVVGEPVLPYRETVISSSSRSVTSKTRNRLNRLSMMASPVDEKLLGAIDSKLIGPGDASDDLGIDDKSDARNVWCLGSASSILINKCPKGTLYVNDIRESIVTGFKEAAKAGVLAGEPLRGVRIDVTEAQLHMDAAHRGIRQLEAAAKRAIHAAQLAASPRLMEPMYSLEVMVPESRIGRVESFVATRRGVLELSEYCSDSSVMMKGLLPVKEISGFAEHLSLVTHGEGSVALKFGGWQVVESDPLEADSAAAQLVAELRARRMLGPLPSVAQLEEPQ